ncbi:MULTISPECIES: ABC transporter permease [unclassified Pseudomonas]|uniref:ABC transporter permease n=1 Tax=unclassified Pseudomonas TaxID=196821 RepID=UPI00119BAF9F|nr:MULTISPECIES: ABC transporter permease [unclassified Pseudomonas]TWC17541.1 peptide/nickel transport system permease protein [Pseudomonas sp. SJZ074]TWC19668.1 peptide/nickel transport system permease protein [Pseudomonas sp. SJZ075]TWC35432.1 peptide/nickel transport system permease protein [Pseudomonas sp. SJZ078]TWC35549.1 peptide/nickel transport system permease protein [Pseudomonas sp. SJZ085]TWC56378.1 peptide/nickel transport system permease protein [Pseudomonas sp. SJZ124]
MKLDTNPPTPDIGNGIKQDGLKQPVAHHHRRRLKLSFSGFIGLLIVSFWALMAIFGPLLAPYDVNAMPSDGFFGPLSAQFPLGTDYLGRDILSRLLHGAPYTIGLALVATLLACSAGVMLGLVAAASGGWIDALISRTEDALISIPNKIFALLMVASFGSSVPLLLCMAAFAYMPGSFRIARAVAVNVMTTDFVRVARTRGEAMPYIIFVEVLPNMLRPVLTDFGLRFVYVVLLLSAMSFLGLGIQPPDADWGSLVRENIQGLEEGAPAVLVPALAIATLTMGVNLLIDSFGGRSTRGTEK